MEEFAKIADLGDIHTDRENVYARVYNEHGVYETKANVFTGGYLGKVVAGERLDPEPGDDYATGLLDLAYKASLINGHNVYVDGVLKRKKGEPYLSDKEVVDILRDRRRMYHIVREREASQAK